MVSYSHRYWFGTFLCTRSHWGRRCGKGGQEDVLGLNPKCLGSEVRRVRGLGSVGSIEGTSPQGPPLPETSPQGPPLPSGDLPSGRWGGKTRLSWTPGGRGRGSPLSLRQGRVRHWGGGGVRTDCRSKRPPERNHFIPTSSLRRIPPPQLRGQVKSDIYKVNPFLGGDLDHSPFSEFLFRGTESRRKRQKARLRTLETHSREGAFWEVFGERHSTRRGPCPARPTGPLPAVTLSVSTERSLTSDDLFPVVHRRGSGKRKESLEGRDAGLTSGLGLPRRLCLRLSHHPRTVQVLRGRVSVGTE